jgi:hypothetical protein
MTQLKHLLFGLLLFGFTEACAQQEPIEPDKVQYVVRSLTIEPALGINLWPSSDLLLTNLLQWNPSNWVSLLSYSSCAYNNVFQRDFNHIHTDYNYSLSQKLGVGVSIYTENFSHTFSILGGVRYDAFKETLENPALENVSISVTSLSPDVGLMYNLKTGSKTYFFSFRTYLPLYPYPFKTLDPWALDGNMANLSLELGIGIWLE